ncbi:hypothetical protein GCM10022222_59980 [Amycolatopsis ultiminotia]|uniref:Ferredoxin n=1 Tax=Amycolatopsis ultiminotia TaxID=543629 RepID=A0ABP6XJY4_9PSEU
MSDVRITVHPQWCMANGACRAAAPDVFGTDEAGWVRLVEPRPPAGRLDAVRAAADSCPVAAIEVDDLASDLAE